MTTGAPRPAFYAVGRGTGGLRDWLTLLHPPYTLWHLSYVAIGAALVHQLIWWRLGLTLLGFFLAVGIGAHALDELRGRPLGTGIPSSVLVVVATTSVVAAMVLGIVEGGLLLLPFVLLGGFLVVAYNLELFGGRMHNGVVFAAAWGAFPVAVGAYTQHWSVPPAAIAGAFAAFFLSLGQRALSTPARELRRRVAAVEVNVTLADGRSADLGRPELLAPLERALRALTYAVLAIAVALLLTHVAPH